MKIKVLFVTQGCDPVLYRYNLGWIIDEMNRNIFDITVVDCGRLDIAPLVREQHFIIYYRVLRLENSAIEFARSIGKFVGYIIDDFLKDYPLSGEFFDVMQNAHFIFVTTKLLKKLYIDAGLLKLFYLKQHGLPIEKLLSLRSQIQPQYPDRFRLGWLGGWTHEEYVKKVEMILQCLTSADFPITFVCFGKSADFVERCRQLPNIRIVNLPFIPFGDETKYYSTLANLALNAVINIVEPSKLSQGKSELKFLETGLYKYPLITPNIGIYSQIIKDGKNGLIANRPQEFAEKVIYLQKNLPKRIDIAETAHNQVLQQYNIKLKAREFESQIFNFFLANAPGGWEKWGRFVKGAKPAVYFLAFGHKNLVPNPQILAKLRCSWEQIHMLSDEEIDAIPDGVILDLTEEEFI